MLFALIGVSCFMWLEGSQMWSWFHAPVGIFWIIVGIFSTLLAFVFWIFTFFAPPFARYTVIPAIFCFIGLILTIILLCVNSSAYGYIYTHFLYYLILVFSMLGSQFLILFFCIHSDPETLISFIEKHE